MSSKFIDNQPIIWTENGATVDACEHVPDYMQIADFTDTAQFQVEVTPCSGGMSVIEDTDFRDALSVTPWVSVGSFSTTTKGMANGGYGATGTMSQIGVFTVGDSYQLIIDVTYLVGKMFVYNGSALVAQITGTGRFYISFTATNPDLNLAIEDSNSKVTLTNVSGFEFSPNMTVGVLDASDNDAQLAMLNINDNPEYFKFVGNTITVSIPWGEFIEETTCARLGFSDGCINTNGQFGLFNPEFNAFSADTTECSGWEEQTPVSSNFIWQRFPLYDVLQIINSGTVALTTTILQDGITKLKPGLSYDVTLDIYAILNGSVKVFIGNTESIAYNTTGVKTFTLVASGTGDLRCGIKFTNTSTSSTGLSLSSLQVSLTYDSDFEFDYYSNNFKVKDTSVDCTKVLNISNDDDAFGFKFDGTGFAPRVRVESNLVNRGYQTDRKVESDSDGSRNVRFGQLRKYKFLRISHQPNYVHDFLVLALLADHFFIDGIEYHVEDDEYQPTFDQSEDEFSTVILQVSEKRQNIINVSAGNTPNPIAATQNSFSIADPDDYVTVIAEPSSGDTVKSL